jgi:Tol biopolymer transport system component
LANGEAGASAGGEDGAGGEGGAPEIDAVILNLTLAADGNSTSPDISNDGRFVVFRTDSGKLAPDAPSGGVLLADVAKAKLTTVRPRDPVDNNPVVPAHPRLSGDGKLVFFRSNLALTADDLDSVEDVYRVRRNGKGLRLASVAPAPEGQLGFWDLATSDDGRFVVFQEMPVFNEPSARRSFVDDLASPAVATQVAAAVISDTYIDSAWRSTISGDGNRIAFDSAALELNGGTGQLHVFVQERAGGPVELVSQNDQGSPGDDQSFAAALSQDGSVVAFSSGAQNLVPGDTNQARDIFVRDLTTLTTSRVSVASDGTQADHYSYQPSLSADGRYVAFLSMASNLADYDLNGRLDVFVHDRATRVTRRVSVTESGLGGAGNDCAPSGLLNCATPKLSADGSVVVFESDAGDLVPGSTPGQHDIYWVNWQKLPIP